MKTEQVIDTLSADRRLECIQVTSVKIRWKSREKLALLLCNQNGVEYRIDLTDLEETEIIVNKLTDSLSIKSPTEVFTTDISSIFVIYTKESYKRGNT